MDVLLVVVPFLFFGIVILFIAFSGGPAAAREAYLTRGGRFAKVAIPVLYLALGIAVPAAVIASRGESEGGVGKLRTESLTKNDENGKVLFRETCWSCHTLAAVQAGGNTGPNLDTLGVDKQRVLNAIKNGGTGSGTMPVGIVTGKEAQAVATYVSSVAGK